MVVGDEAVAVQGVVAVAARDDVAAGRRVRPVADGYGQLPTGPANAPSPTR
jgi:uncharacterized protein YfaA (DUF2138 family)